MDGEHPWRDWLEVLALAAAFVVIVWFVVKLLLGWAYKDDDRSKGGPRDKHNGPFGKGNP
jgi:hypothetical protein